MPKTPKKYKTINSEHEIFESFKSTKRSLQSNLDVEFTDSEFLDYLINFFNKNRDKVD
jgi:hypothetical protein